MATGIRRGSDSAGPAYRPFIDGLRALSVIAVVGYHIGVPGFSGGFVGVDIFFVISGFLIVGQIVDELRRDAFSFADFWSRRALRILPPYLIVVLAATAAAPFILVFPDQFKDLGRQVAYSALMVVNHHFLDQQGYFDAASDTKVLLHLWSLSVEEQFYLAAPIALVASFWAARRRHVSADHILIAVAAITFVVSLAGCILLTAAPGGRNLGFYVAPLRAWEFVAGGAIGFAARYADRWRRPLSFAAWPGLAAIFAAIALYSPATAYPSVFALAPVAGAAALILAGLADPRTAVARCLAVRPMVAVGLVSYAWYLWHWPLLAYARLLNFGDHDVWNDAAACLVAFGLAITTHLLVERPIRQWRRRQTALLRSRPAVVGVAACVVAALSGQALLDDVGKRALIDVPPQYMPAAALAEPVCDLRTAGDATTCLALADGRRIGLLAGDSQALGPRDAVARYAAAHGAALISAVSAGCAPLSGVRFSIYDPAMEADCRRMKSSIAARFSEGLRPTFAMLYARWPIYVTDAFGNSVAPLDLASPADQATAFAAGLRASIAELKDAGAERILVLGVTPVFARPAPYCLYLADRHRFDRGMTCGVARARVEASRAEATAALLAATASLEGVRHVDPLDDFCDAARCLPYAGDTILFLDTNHMADAGMERILSRHAADFAWLVATSGDRADGR